MPDHLFIHGYLKLGGEKMSKTRGNVMDPFPLIEQYGADPFRFYCLREVSFGQDGIVSEEGFKARYNAELANELGNLVSRTTSMIAKYRGGAVPAPPPGRAPSESPLADEAEATAEKARTQLEDMDLSAALDTIWVFVRRLNRYVEERAPWKLAKEEGARTAAEAEAGAELDATLWDLAEGLRLLSVLLYPFIPETASVHPGATRSRYRPTLAGLPGWNEARWGLLPEAPAVVGGAPSSRASRTDRGGVGLPNGLLHGGETTTRMFIDSHTHLGPLPRGCRRVDRRRPPCRGRSCHTSGHRHGPVPLVGRPG